MSLDKLCSKDKRCLWPALLAALLVISLASAYVFWKVIDTSREIQHYRPLTAKVAPTPVALKSKILFSGNSFWGRYTNDAAMKTDKPYEFPFARLGEFGRENYDAWVTGLECPTTEKAANMTSAQMEEALVFNCNPAYLPEFAKWFTAVSLANNHTDNQGADGFTETQAALAKNNVQYFGHYDPEALNDVCDIVAVPVRVKMSDGSEQKNQLPIAMCGYHFVFKLPSAQSIALISECAKYLPTIVLPHGGAEYRPAPDEIKTRLYRSMIDAGADMVIGDHPHWVQTTEAYSGKLIVYSMGNFMFDQQWAEELMRSAAIEVDVEWDQSAEIDSWTSISGCEQYQDDCLETIKNLGLKKPTLKYRFGVIATGDKGYQTYLAPDLQAVVEQRLGWQQTMQALGQE